MRIYLLNKYLVVCYVPCTTLGAGALAINFNIPASVDLSSCLGEKIVNMTSNLFKGDKNEAGMGKAKYRVEDSAILNKVVMVDY